MSTHNSILQAVGTFIQTEEAYTTSVTSYVSAVVARKNFTEIQALRSDVQIIAKQREQAALMLSRLMVSFVNLGAASPDIEIQETQEKQEA
jgi:hypothetical protein